MRCFWISLLMMPMMLSATSALAQLIEVRDEEDAFSDRIERSDETKEQVESTKPHVTLHPGPEGSPADARMLLKDRLEVLQHNRAIAVQQKKPAVEIAKIDAQIKDIQQQLTAYQ